MSGPADDAAEIQPDRLTSETVSAWLRRHPDFLQENLEVLTFLTPPEFKRGERILDMQRFMLDRVQEELAGLRRREKQLLQAVEGNAAGQSKIHQAVVAIVEECHALHKYRAAHAVLPTKCVELAVQFLCNVRGT